MTDKTDGTSCLQYTTQRMTRTMIPKSPADTVIKLDSEEINLWANKSVFTANGSLSGWHKFTAAETQFLRLRWPHKSFAAISYWHANIDTSHSKRPEEKAIKFTKATAENVGQNDFEFVKKVMEKCHHKFDACLLEVSSHGAKFGHVDLKSAREVKERRGEMEDIVMLLLADTDYTFLDVFVKWEVNITSEPLLKWSVPQADSHDQQSTSRPDSLAIDGPSNSLSLVTEGDSVFDQDQGRDLEPAMTDTPILQSLLSEIRDMKSYQIKLIEKMDDTCSSLTYICQLLSKGPPGKQEIAQGNDTDDADKDGNSDRALPLLSSSSFNSTTDDISGHVAQSNRILSAGTHTHPHSVHENRTAQQLRDHTASPGRGQSSQQSNKASLNTESQSSSGEYMQSERTSVKDIDGVSGRDQSHERNNRQTQRADNTDRSRSGNMTGRPTQGPSLSHARGSAAGHNSQRPAGQSSQKPTAKPSDTRPPPRRETPPQSSRQSTPGSQSSTSDHEQSSDRSKRTSSGPAGDSGQGSKHISDLELRVEIGSDSEAKLIHESVDRAYLLDEKPAPKAKSFDTILCLDVSQSMKGVAFKQMKETALNFVNGIEDMVNDTGIEENIGLVAFGGRANVVQNLTNDFTRIREAIENLKPGGTSPFVEALLVSMAAFVRKGGIVSVSGEWEVRPRIIFLSDGHPTESMENVERDLPLNINNVRVSVSRMLLGFKHSESFQKVHPVVFIPVGDHADMKYMSAMADLCGGQYVERKNVLQLCQYFRVQETIGKVLVCLKREAESATPERVKATVSALTPDLSDDEKEKILEVVERELKNPSRLRNRRTKPDDLEYIVEDIEKVEKGRRLALGARVVRGKDWKWDNQDSGGPGTVINQHEKRSLHWVCWDLGGYNCYTYSEDNGYHIRQTHDHPRLKGEGEELQIGMTVKKGPDWNPKEAEEGTGVRGIIIRKSESKGKLVVRWPNRVKQVCNWSPNGPHEVEYCSPAEEMDHQTSSRRSAPAPSYRAPENGRAEEETANDSWFEHGRWQWRDPDGTWHDYDKKTNQDIETVYKKRPNSSCVIKRDDIQRRIMFRRKVEKVVDGGVECEVQRIPV